MSSGKHCSQDVRHGSVGCQSVNIGVTCQKEWNPFHFPWQTEWQCLVCRVSKPIKVLPDNYEKLYEWTDCKTFFENIYLHTKTIIVTMLGYCYSSSVVSFTQCSPTCGQRHAPASGRTLCVTVARSSAVQASSSRRQERRWAIVCGSPQSQSTD